MRTNQWVAICLVLLVVLNMGTVVAQDDRPDPHPVITPDNVAQLQEVQRLGNGALKPVVAWSADGTQLAAGGYGGFWLYASLTQPPEFHPLSVSTENVAFMFAPQGDLLLLGDRQQIIAYDLDQRSIRYTLAGIQPLAFSHNGDWLAYEVDDGVRISRATTGEIVYDLSYVGKPYWPPETGPEDNYTQSNSITFAQFLPDDNRLIVKWETLYSATWEGIENRGYDVWSLTDDQPSAMAVEDAYDFLPRYPDLLSVLPDGQLFAIKEDTITTEQGTYVFDPAPSGSYVSRPHDLQGGVIASSYNLPGTSGPRSSSEVVGIWDVRTGEQINQIPAAGALALSPDDSQIVIDTTVYEVATGKIVARLQNDNYRILPGTDRILLLKADNTLHLLDAANLVDVATLDMTRSELGGSAIPHYFISPETNTLLLRTRDAKRWVRIDLENGETLTAFETPDAFTGYVTYTPDNRYLIAEIRGQWGDYFLLWDVGTGQPVDLPVPTHIVRPVLTPNGLLVLWDPEIFEVILYDVNLSSRVMVFPTKPIKNDVSSAIRFSPQNTYLGIQNAQAFEIWDWQTGETELSLADVLYPAFSPDDKRLVYQANQGMSVEVISLPEGELIWQMDLDYMIHPPEFVTDTILKIDPLWAEMGGATCYDSVRLLQLECPAPEPISPALVTGEMRFFGNGIVTDLSRNELTHLPLRHDAVRLAFSSDQTRLWVEHADGTLGVWAVVSPQ